MNKWRNHRQVLLCVLILFSILNILVEYFIVQRHFINLDLYYWIIGPLCFLLLIATFDIGGKYVLYANLFVFFYMFYAGVGQFAAFIGDDGKNLTFLALSVSGASFVLLAICLAILARRHVKRKASKR